MFILTIDSSDPHEIKSVLKDVNKLKHLLYEGCTGQTDGGVTYEFVNLDEQPWLAMAEFLPFDEDGNTLKKR